jgi:hypothetical protein
MTASRLCACFTVGVTALVSIVGCGGRPASVAGVVKIAGSPLENGVVTFTPAKGGPSAYGTITAGGNYELKTGAGAGIELGDYVVTVAANATPEQAATMGIKVGREGIMPLLTPVKYANTATSPLKVTVKAGRQQLDFDLEKREAGAGSR